MQPDGQSRTRPKFPPKLRWRARPRSSESRSTGSGAGLRDGSRPRGTSRKVKAEPEPNPGANSWRRTPSVAWWRGSAGHPTSLYTCSARCRAPDTWEPSPGLPSSRRGLATSPGRAPFAPGPPNQEEAARWGAGRLAPGASFILGPRQKPGGSFVLFKPTLHSQQLPATSTLPCYLADRRTRDTKKKTKQNKTTAPRVSSSSLEPGGRRRESTSFLLLPIRLGYPGRFGQQGTPRWPIEKR